MAFPPNPTFAANTYLASAFLPAGFNSRYAAIPSDWQAVSRAFFGFSANLTDSATFTAGTSLTPIIPVGLVGAASISSGFSNTGGRNLSLSGLQGQQSSASSTSSGLTSLLGALRSRFGL